MPTLGYVAQLPPFDGLVGIRIHTICQAIVEFGLCIWLQKRAVRWRSDVADLETGATLHVAPPNDVHAFDDRVLRPSAVYAAAILAPSARFDDAD